MKEYDSQTVFYFVQSIEDIAFDVYSNTDEENPLSMYFNEQHIDFITIKSEMPEQITQAVYAVISEISTLETLPKNVSLLHNVEGWDVVAISKGYNTLDGMKTPEIFSLGLQYDSVNHEINRAFLGLNAPDISATSTLLVEPKNTHEPLVLIRQFPDEEERFSIPEELAEKGSFTSFGSFTKLLQLLKLSMSASQGKKSFGSSS
jgi:hypothetical protein